MIRILSVTFLAFALAAQAPQYDLVLRNGHVIDPKNNVDAKRDVAILDGKIAAIEPSIPASAAKKSVDISGLYLTPGLVDIHVPLYRSNRRLLQAILALAILAPQDRTLSRRKGPSEFVI